jgi:hypothetical protein
MRIAAGTFILFLLPLSFARADDAQAVRVTAASYAQLQVHLAAPLVVEPVVFAGVYALADWNCAGKEGEVLLLRGADGNWHVIAFENNTLADEKFLTVRYHVPQSDAVTLVQEIIAAEKREGARP